MRNLPKKFNDFQYLLSKIGLSFFRGIFNFIFFKKGSKIPFLGMNIKFICRKNISFGSFVWLGHHGYLDAFSKNGVSFGNNVTVREFFVIQCRSGLNPAGDSLIIKDNTFIGPFCKIGVGGNITIGSNCQIGAYCSLNAESHKKYNGAYTSGKISRKGILIGDNVWIGDGVIILDGVSIGSNSVIGAGSLVTKSIPKNTIAFGIPAKKKRT